MTGLARTFVGIALIAAQVPPPPAVAAHRVGLPEKVVSVVLSRVGDELEISWQRYGDAALPAYYRIYAGKEQIAETDRLSIRTQASACIAVPLTIVAYDLYGNASEPSEPVFVCGER
jgi:hypothetical protein